MVKMEVVPMRLPKSNGPNAAVDLPFNRRNVEEWSRLDRLTGIMETAKIETDHWAARTSNAAHKYGKVVDSRERNNADGSLQERQRKQMEVFQTKVPGGSMQVIRTQTITTSSKKWSSTSDKIFDDLKLPVNPLDLTSQKTKGSVGRSGSIGGRRPPTRPRSLISRSSNSSAFDDETSVFRLSQQVHQRSNAFCQKVSDEESDRSGVIITDVTNQSSSAESSLKNGLTRQKSCSNENLTVDSDDDSILRRSSKLRRSLQCHKQSSQGSLDGDPAADEYDLAPMKSLKERAAEIEKLLGRGSATQPSPIPDRPSDATYGKIKLLKAKDSFVSAETLKEVRERLKKPFPAGDDVESKDDGIVTEKNDSSLSARMNGQTSGYRKPAINGTGSLESRYTNKSSVNGTRTSEWYRRRKSYGFEQVDEYDKFDKINGKKKNHMDSSTDSGICQSSETMGLPSWTKNSDSIWTKMGSESGPKKESLSNVVTVRVKKDLPMDSLIDKGINSVYLDGIQSHKNGDVKKPFGYNKENSSPTEVETSWTRNSPEQFQKPADSYKSSLKTAKNPWLSQLRGTKLVDRDWSADELATPAEEQTQQQQQQQMTTTTTTTTTTTSSLFDRKEDSNGDSNGQKKSKKVEFCKTEVHFAAESGKFNIVETDGKPPPNDFFRRRRRSSATSASKDVNGLPEVKFGDSALEKTMLAKPEKVESISEKIEAELKELSRIVIEALPQTEKRMENSDGYKRKNSWLYDVAEESVAENEASDSSKPRSILKTYGHGFGSNDSEFKRPKPLDDWSRRSPIPVWQSTVVLRNKRFDDVKRTDDDDRKLYSSDGESELQIHVRNMRKIDTAENKKLWNESSYDRKFDSKRRSLPDDVFLRNSMKYHNGYNHNNSSQLLSREKMAVSTEEMPTLSVAERIKQVEQLKQSNNYSTKINFRSGEMTVVQNGSSAVHGLEPSYEERKKTMTSWANQRKIASFDDGKPEVEGHQVQQPLLSCDELTTSNPSVTRFSTHADKSDNQKYQTTRILINFKTSPKNDTTTPTTTTTTTTKTTDNTQSAEKMINNTTNNNNHNNKHKQSDPCGSWPAGSSSKKDLTKYLKELKSASLVREAIHPDHSHSEQQPRQQQSQQREDIPKPSKPVHEIIDQFDSLSRSTMKEKRRKPIPYRASKEYTHSDLEEELKNFTENLDKDFRDIYEEEIGSFRKSRSLRETKSKSAETFRMENLVRPVIQPSRTYRYSSLKSSSGDETASKKSSLRTSSKDNYDTDDSDLLADEEVRSYMSTGQGGSESETEGSGSRKSFRESILRFKKLEAQTKEEKEIKNSQRGSNLQSSPAFCPKPSLRAKFQDPSRNLNKSPRIASIALKYEDDPYYSKRIYQNLKSVGTSSSHVVNTCSNELNTEAWERTSNSSSAMSGSKPRERVSYLNGLSLSEKYSKNLRRSSDSSLDAVSDAHLRKCDTLLDEPSNEYSTRKNTEKPIDEKHVNGFAKRSQAPKNHSEDRYVSEKSSIRRSMTKTEHEETHRRRLKTEETDKPSSQRNQKSLIDRYQMKHEEKVERNQTDGDLEELKKAAEEIIMAVNGYTDDSSHVGSSGDDDRPRRVIRKDKIGNLGTISEGKRVTKTETRKTVSTHAHAKRTCNQSSASSTESLNREPVQKPSRETRSSSRHRHGGIGVSNGKTSSARTSRSLHRATREAVIGHRSSSEDIPSCVEQVKRRVVRRQKSSSKPEVTSEAKTTSCHRHRSKSRGTESPSTLTNKNTKAEKPKETTNVMRTTRSSRTIDGDKTRSSSSHRKTATADKPDVETMKKRRSQRIASGRDEYPSEQMHRRRSSSSKKPEASKVSPTT